MLCHRAIFFARLDHDEEAEKKRADHHDKFSRSPLNAWPLLAGDGYSRLAGRVGSKRPWLVADKPTTRSPPIGGVK